jgi:hypothetical protein
MENNFQRHLNHNKLTTIPPKLFQGLKSLDSMYVWTKGNELKLIDICQTTKLRVFQKHCLQICLHWIPCMK